MKMSVMTVMAPDYRLEELVPLMKRIGYDCIEPAIGYKKALWDQSKTWHISDENLKEELKSLSKLCASNGIKICSLASGIPSSDPAKVERYFDAIAEVGCPMARVGALGYDGKTKYKELFERALKEIETVEKLAKKYKVKAIFETHMKNIIPSASAAYRMVSRFDPAHIGIIFDPANGVVEGWEAFGVDLLGKYLAHVHVKNLRWDINKTGEQSYFTQGKWIWTFCGIPDGIADWPQVFKALKAVDYQGAVSFEDFEGGYVQKPVGITTEEKLKRDFNDVKAILKNL